jgi:pilus assembly protein Flp/PilA
MVLVGLAKAMGTWLAARIDVRSDRGASAVEYAIMVAMIAAVIILAVVFLGQKTSDTFSCTASSLQSKTNAC